MPVSVCMQAELQTERQKSVLFDNTESPLRSLSSGCRFEFTVKHVRAAPELGILQGQEQLEEQLKPPLPAGVQDVKELGAHTLAATALYSTIDGERKVSTQIFKFSSSSTLSVRTRTRVRQ